MKLRNILVNRVGNRAKLVRTAWLTETARSHTDTTRYRMHTGEMLRNLCRYSPVLPWDGNGNGRVGGGVYRICEIPHYRGIGTEGIWMGPEFLGLVFGFDVAGKSSSPFSLQGRAR